MQVVLVRVGYGHSYEHPWLPAGTQDPVSWMQEMGYSVDVLVLPDNQCQTKEFLLGTAAGLRIKLDPQRVSVVAVQKDDTKLAVSGCGCPRGVCR